MNRLEDYGWNRALERVFDSLDADGLEPARVVAEQRGMYRVAAECGVVRAEISGRLRHEGLDAGDRPAVGDWVAAELAPDGGLAVIHHVLARRGQISRKAAGKATAEQVLAANLDRVFTVTSCNEDLNPRRIERYLTITWDSGADPVVLLNKSDLVEDAAELVARAEAAALGVPVHAVSALADGGLAPLEPYLTPGVTVALLGSSGVGKSSIVNRLMGCDVQAVRSVREDDARGRHATTARQLFRLPSGALLIDTPGLREIGLWHQASGLDRTFPDIARLAQSCRYQDCTHLVEPDCAVRSALASGDLEPGRFESYRKLHKELAHLARRTDPEALANTKRRWKAIHKNVRAARKKGWLR